MFEYNYLDESLENEINNLELPEEINKKIDKDYELNFSEDENFNLKSPGRSPDKNSKKKNIPLSKSNLINTKNDANLDEEFDKYLHDLDKKIEEEVLREELEKNRAEINLNSNSNNLGKENDIAKAHKLLEEDDALRYSIEKNLLSFDDIVNYIDYYQIFTFINKSQKLALDQFTKISDLCEKETFVETEMDIKKKIESTLKITDRILDEKKFNPEEVLFMDQKKRFVEEKFKEEQKKKNEKDYLFKKSELENKAFLKELILTTRDKHIEIDDVYQNVNENKIILEEIEEKEKEEDGKKDNYQFQNKLDVRDVENIVDNDREYKFLEKITKNDNYLSNLKIEKNKNNNRIFFVEKDLEDLENFKKGKIKSNNNYNELSNPLHNLDDFEINLLLNKDLNESNAQSNYNNLLADLYKKHEIKYEYNEINSKKISNKKTINEKNEKQNNEKLSQTIESIDFSKKYGNQKKMIPPLKNKNLINYNGIAKLNNLNNNDIINNLIKTKEQNLENIDLKSQISCLDMNNDLKESLSKFSFKSKFSNGSAISNKTNPIKNIDLFTTDNKMTNLIKVRELRKEYLKTKVGLKSNKRPDLFSFNTKHILINDKEENVYDNIFEIIQETKEKNSNELTNLQKINANNIEIDKSIDSVNSKSSSFRRKIEQAISYSKNKFIK